MQDDKPAIEGDFSSSLEDIGSEPEVISANSGDGLVSANQYAEQLARVASEKDELQAKVDADRSQAITELIKPSADRAFYFMWAYCAGIFVLLLLHGFSLCGFNLPKSAIDFLVGSTAVTVIGLAGMVLTGVFLGTRR